VARVFDAELTREQLKERLPDGLAVEDSLKRSRVIVNTWVRRQVLLAQAKFNLESEELRFQEMISDYENDLYIHEFERRFVTQELDTLVSDQDIEEFYHAHESDFQLKSKALRIRFLQYDSEQADVKPKAIKKAFKGFSEEDSLFLRSFASEHAIRYIDATEQWVMIRDLAKESPWELSYLDERLEQRDYIELDEEGRRSLLKVEELRMENELSPIELVKENIRNTILNQRKLRIISDMRDELFQQALAEGDIYIVE
jgi:hypothetical protein